jgi:myo-inositol-1(or 4)-monophosphatase
MNRNIKKNTVEYYNKILENFIEINNFALVLINEWRKGKKLVELKINVNGVSNPVTSVDYGIEEFAAVKLNKFDSSVSIFGEESFQNDFSTTHKSQYFVVDPIDGTDQFIDNNSDWSISLCYVEDGKPVVASIFMPDKNIYVTAVKNKGIRVTRGKSKKYFDLSKKIGVSPRQIKEQKYFCIVNKTGFEPVPISSLTPKICSIITGEVDAAVYFSQRGQSASLWDYAAAVLIIQEAGGKITSLSGRKLPFSGNDVIHKDGWLAAKSPEVYKYLIDYLK